MLSKESACLSPSALLPIRALSLSLINFKKKLQPKSSYNVLKFRITKENDTVEQYSNSFKPLNLI